jgi:DNA-binding transcriptional LysR family regulator
MDVRPLLPHVADSASLRYFAAVARVGSFRQAAAKLRIVASAVSRQVKMLEDELGVPLFERGRGRNGLRLTPAGEILLRRVDRALAELADAQREIGELQHLERGSIRLGVNGPYTGILVTRLLKEFHERRPRLDIHVITGNTPHLVSLLRTDEIDVALVNNLRDKAGVSVEAETRAHLSLLVPRGHVLAGNASVGVAELAGYELIMPDETLLLKQIIDSLFGERGIVPKVALTTNSLDFMRDLVEIGFGIAIASSPNPVDPARSNTLHVPLRDQPATLGTLACCTKPGRTLSPAVASFVESLRAALLSQPLP